MRIITSLRAVWNTYSYDISFRSVLNGGAVDDHVWLRNAKPQEKFEEKFEYSFALLSCRFDNGVQ